MKNTELKFKDLIDDLILEINIAKSVAEKIHKSGNIRASGNQVENLIRDKISLFLPDRYLVKQGHIINSDGKVSMQFDIIIFDRLSTPKFFEASDNTVYYPIESVLAVGEIKKTLRNKDIIDFSKKIKYLKVDMNRKLVKNKVYDGPISDLSTLADIVNLKSNRKYKNPLFTFIFAVDCNNVGNLLFSETLEYMPNDIYILNFGYYLYGSLNSDKTFFSKIEDEYPIMNSWAKIEKPGTSCLATMLNNLINHLNKCDIKPFSITNYMSNDEDFGIRGSEVKVFNIIKK